MYSLGNDNKEVIVIILFLLSSKVTISFSPYKAVFENKSTSLK